MWCLFLCHEFYLSPMRSCDATAQRVVLWCVRGGLWCPPSSWRPPADGLVRIRGRRLSTPPRRLRWSCRDGLLDEGKGLSLSHTQCLRSVRSTGRPHGGGCRGLRVHIVQASQELPVCGPIPQRLTS